MRILKIDYQSENAPKEFAESIRDTGFAIFYNHPIKPELLKSVQEDWQNFFASANKHDYLYGNDFMGYYPYKIEQAKGYDKRNLCEYFHKSMKSKLPSSVGPTTQELFDTGYRIVQELAEWLYNETPGPIKSKLEEPLQDMVKDCTTSIIRILHYPALKGDEEQGEIRAAEHEDINILTVLPAETSKGLQVKDNDGVWHEVQCDPGTLVINAGDMLQLATDKYYRSTTHRVVNPKSQTENVPRFSFPMFFQARNEIQLTPGFTAADYLRERFIENNVLKKD